MWFARFQWKRRHATTIPAILSIVKLQYQSSLSYVDSNPCNIITTIAIPAALAFLYESTRYFDFLTIESKKDKKDFLFFKLNLLIIMIIIILNWNRFKICDVDCFANRRICYNVKRGLFFFFLKKERKNKKGMANWCHEKLF